MVVVGVVVIAVVVIVVMVAVVVIVVGVLVLFSLTHHECTIDGIALLVNDLDVFQQP